MQTFCQKFVIKNFYDINSAACYLNKEMFVIRKVLP